MSSQVTVRLQDDLSKALASRARKTGEKPSEIIRAALREHLGLTGVPGSKPAERVRRLIGSVDSGNPDLAERHREYVLESLRRAR